MVHSGYWCTGRGTLSLWTPLVPVLFKPLRCHLCYQQKADVSWNSRIRNAVLASIVASCDNTRMPQVMHTHTHMPYTPNHVYACHLTPLPFFVCVPICLLEQWTVEISTQGLFVGLHSQGCGNHQSSPQIRLHHLLHSSAPPKKG